MILIVLIVLILIFIYRYNYKKEYKKESKISARSSNDSNLIYCRELPNDYSPAIVSILCNYQIEVYKDLPAVILNLCAKRYIDIVENNGKYSFIVINNNEDTLMQSDLYVLNWIKHIDTMSFDREKWKEIITNDAINIGIIEHKNINEIKSKVNKSAKKLFLKPVLIVLLIILIPFIILFVGTKFIKNNLNNYTTDVNNNSTITTEEPETLNKELKELDESINLLFNDKNTYIGLIILFIGLLFIIGIPIFIVSVFVKHKPITEVMYDFEYKRTNKGNIDYEKWQAFKKFLLDFSMINTRNIQEVYLWEFYLAYATSLGIAEQVLNTSNSNILHNKAFNIINYPTFMEGIDKSLHDF